MNSLIFSSDGKSLVSGSDDNTIKLWDMQTGGVIKTFYGHTNWVRSVSISADCTMIASGSTDKTIRLWNIQTGKCHCVIKQRDIVYHVGFSPTDPQHLLSISSDEVWQWDINGYQIPPTYCGSHVAFSLDGSQFISCYWGVATVRNSNSRETVAEFYVVNRNTYRCCFSPDGRLIAVAAGCTAYIWDITNSDPYLVETFIGHTDDIKSLAFSSPSSLISASNDQSVKFWQIGSSPTALGGISSAPIKSITLQARDGITITSDSDGVVRTWDVSTGHYKTSFQTPAKTYHKRDVQLIGGKLIIVWDADGKIHIQDVEKGKLLLAVDGPTYVKNLRISGDGSRVFCLGVSSIQAWFIQTGEVVGKVKINSSGSVGPLTVDGSRVWIHHPESEYQEWDFGTSGSSPVHLSNIPTLHLNGTMVWDISQSTIKDTATGKVVFQLSGRFANPVDVQCDGCYLVAGYSSGEILILDFSHVFPQ